MFEDSARLSLQEFAQYLQDDFPERFETVERALRFIERSRVSTGTAKLITRTCKEVVRRKPRVVGGVSGHEVQYYEAVSYRESAPYIEGSELNRFIKENLQQRKSSSQGLQSVLGRRIEDKCRNSVIEQGFYNAGLGNLYISSFTASAWIGLGITGNNDTEAARLAVTNIEQKLIDAVKNKVIRQIDADGIGRLEEGIYQSDGLFLESDVKAWAKDTFPRCKLCEFYDEPVFTILQELHDEKYKIYKFFSGADVIEKAIEQKVSSKAVRERDGAAKDFVELGTEAYKKKYGGYPEKLGQLLKFAKSSKDAVNGYTIIDEGKGNSRRIFFTESKEHRESATYQGISDAFRAWKSKNKEV